MGMEADFKKSWRVRNEQANFEKGVADFRNASKAEGALVNTPGCSSGSTILNKDSRSWPELVAQLPVECFTEIPKPSCSHSLAVLQISTVQKLYLEYRFSVALKRALLETYVFSKLLWTFSGRPWLSTTRASLRMCGVRTFSRHSLCQNGYGLRFVERLGRS